MSWVKHMSRPHGSTLDKADVSTRALLDSFPGGQPCPYVIDALGEAFEACKGDQGSRHDQVRERVLAIVRLGEEGHHGSRSALGQVRATFISAVTPDRLRGAAEARNEFTRMLTGALAIVASEPTHPDSRGCDHDEEEMSETDPEQIPESSTDSGSDQQLPEAGTLDSDPHFRREVRKIKRSIRARKQAERELADEDSEQEEQIGDLVLFSRDDQPAPLSRIHPRSDGQGLLYRGELHWIYGRPAAGKSWVSSWLIGNTLEAGEHVVLLDYENTPKRIIDRLVDLGVDEDAIEAGLHLPTIKVINSPARELALRRYLEAVRPALVVVDAMNPCLTAHSLDENRSGDINRIVEALINPARQLGATAVVLDHVTKDPKGASYPINSQAKLAQVTGIAYRMDTAEDFKPRCLNEAALVVAKDRHGDVLAIADQDQAALFKLDSRSDDMRAWADPVMLPAPDDELVQISAETFAKRLREHHEAGREPATRQQVLAGGDLLAGTRSRRAEIVDHAVQAGLVKVVREGRRKVLISLVTGTPDTGGVYYAPPDVPASDQGFYEPKMSESVSGSGSSVTLLDSVEDVIPEIAGLEVGLDIETSGVDIYSPDFEVRTVQVSKAGATWVVDAQKAGAASIARLLAEAGSLLAHNATFDLAALGRWIGIDPALLVAKTTDTLTLSRLADPRGDHDLKSLIRAHVDPDYDADSAALAECRRLGIKGVRKAGAATTHLPVDNPVFLRYAALDASTLPPLAARFREQLPAGLVAFERQVSGIAIGMTYRGVAVDRERVNSTIDLLNGRLVDLEAGAARYGLETLAVNHKVDKEKLARTLKRCKVHVRRTPSGAPKFDEEAIEAYAAKAPEQLKAVLSDIIAHRQADKLRHYLAGYLTASASDGRVHPKVNTLEARTGRMSMAEPNLQNVPRAGGIRECFIPDPGCVVVSADFRQIEPRVVAALSGDEAMVEATQEADLYLGLAEQAFGPGARSERRDQVKVVVLAWTYGGEPAGIARQTGLTPAEVTGITKSLAKAFPRLRGYRERMRAHTAPITLDSGRVVYPDGRATAAANYAVQGNARDIFAQAMVRVADAGLERFMWFPVHDELVFGVPQDDVAGTTMQIEQAMSSEFRGVQIPVECKVLGERWSK